jgi:ketosteroid isomerase-like protein
MKSIPMDTSHLDKFIDEYHVAIDELMRGSAKRMARLYSQHDDASLANPFGPIARGRHEVSQALDSAADYFHDGFAAGFERVAAFACTDLAYMVEKEDLRARLGPGPDVMPFTLRVTTVFRHESDNWKIVHRHADPIVRTRRPDSVVPEDERAGTRREGGVVI